MNFDNPDVISKMYNLISTKECGCLLIEDFYSQKESSILYEKIISNCKFETKHFLIYGKLLPMPRTITYFGENDYKYSGVVHNRQAIPNYLTEIINDFIQSEYILKYIKKENIKLLNSCLVNYYQDGNDHIHFTPMMKKN